MLLNLRDEISYRTDALDDVSAEKAACESVNSDKSKYLLSYAANIRISVHIFNFFFAIF